MPDPTSQFEKVKTLLTEAYRVLADFMRGLAEIKKEEQKIIKAVDDREIAQKISSIKSKINKL